MKYNFISLFDLLDKRSKAIIVIVAFVIGGFVARHEYQMMHMRAEITALEEKRQEAEHEIWKLKICCAAHRIEINNLGKE